MIAILVTGASGFVGKCLINLLIKKGYFVRAACRSMPQIDSVNNTENYEWQHFDLTDENVDYNSLLENIDIVVHLAAQVHIMNGISKDVVDGYQILNTRGTQVLANEAANRDIKRFIFLSTIKVNGEGSDNRVMKAEDLPNPQDPYAISKYEAEQALKDIQKIKGMEYVILRPPLVFGPGVRANILRLLTIISKRYPLPFAAIENCRSLIYVGNLADIIVSCVHLPAAANKIYLTKDIDISTPKLIRAIARAFGHHIILFPVPLSMLTMAGIITGRTSTINRLTGSLVIDDSPVRKELNWKPAFNIEEAMKKTVTWYRDSQ
jgi:nucleoside-diphosphate-sugar epimerase